MIDKVDLACPQVGMRIVVQHTGPEHKVIGCAGVPAFRRPGNTDGIGLGGASIIPRQAVKCTADHAGNLVWPAMFELELPDCHAGFNDVATAFVTALFIRCEAIGDVPCLVELVRQHQCAFDRHARAAKRILELGTSYGYSTLFMADAAHEVGAQVISMDIADYKQAYAREKLAEAGLADYVDLRCGDAIAMIDKDEGPIDFVLLDIWNDLYAPCFQAFHPKLSEEAIIASDNMISLPSARRKFANIVRR